MEKLPLHLSMPVLNANRKKLWIAQPGADFAAELAGFFASKKKK